MAMPCRSVLLIVTGCVVLAACAGTVDVGEPTTTSSVSQASSAASQATTTIAADTSATTVGPVESSTTSTASTTTSTTLPDTSPPMLEVTYPTQGEVVSDEVLQFRGVTEPGAEVVSGRWPADVDADGNWSLDLVLQPGDNVAVFTARDAAGNEAEVRTAVTLAACATSTSAVIPDAATDVSSVTGDVDGDGADDTVTVFLDQSGRRWVHMELDYGYAAAIPLETGSIAGEAVGTVRFGGSDAVALVKVSEGASTEQFGVFAFLGCDVVYTTYEVLGIRGEPLVVPTWFTAGASVAHASGLACTPMGVVQTYSQFNGGTDWENGPWDITDEEFTYDPAKGHFDLTSTSTTQLTWANDQAAIEAVYHFDCPGGPRW